ncbi:MAG: DUF1554 domain-containing protein [Pseudomonadota bacterium]
MKSMRWLRWSLLAFSTLLWGCGDCGGSTDDAGPVDASRVDSGNTDTRGQDGATGLDSSTGLDTASRDLAATDTVGQDLASTHDAATGDGGSGGLSIYAIQDTTHANHPAADTEVTFGGVVTAVDNRGGTRGIWVQEPNGGKYSGIYVFKPASSSVDLGTFAVGDVVTVSGTYVEYFELSEINLGSAGTITKTGTATPLTPSAATDIATDAEGWEGVLVRLAADCEVEAAPDSHGEVQTSCGMVDDELFTPPMLVGEVYTHIDGLWHYAFSAFKLIPRDAADLGSHSTVDGGAGDAATTSDASTSVDAAAEDGAVSTDAGVVEDAAVADAAVEDAATPPGYLIFVTVSNHDGDLVAAGGQGNAIASADHLCNTSAANPNAGTYKALIVDGVNRVACTSANCTTSGTAEHVDWVFKPNTQYLRADGVTPIFTSDAAGVFDFGASGNTNTFDNSTHFNQERYWTGLDWNWTSVPSQMCGGTWASNSNSVTGDFGSSDLTTADAIGGGSVSCDQSSRLLCVEQ